MPILRILIYKNLNGAGSKGEWSNSYEVESAEATDSVIIAQRARALAVAESKFHLNTVTFTRATVSTFFSEQKNGQLNDHAEVPLGFNGQIADQVAPDGIQRKLPPEVVLVVKRKAGKSTGRLTYRHAIATQDWIGEGSGIKLNQAKFDQVNQAWATDLEQSNPPAQLARHGRNTLNGSPSLHVTSLTCIGAANRQVTARRKKKKAGPTKGPEAVDAVVVQAKETNDSLFTRVITNIDDYIQGTAEFLALMSGAYQIAVRAIQTYNEVRRYNGLPPVAEPPGPPALGPA